MNKDTNINDSNVGKENDGLIKGEKKMAVSKATLSCVQGKAGTRLIEDIKATKVNKDLVKNCKTLIEKLAKGEFSK